MLSPPNRIAGLALSCAILLLAPLGAGLSQPAPDGPWFVITGTFRSKPSAQAQARQNGGWVLRTDLYSDLTPGLFAVVRGPFEQRPDAEAVLEEVRRAQPEAYVRSAGRSILPAALGDPALLAALLGEVAAEASAGAPGAPCAPDEPYRSVRMMGPGGDMLGAFQVLTRTGEVRAVRPCAD